MTTLNLDDVVSSESEELILVDECDREIGGLSKASCHDGAGILHRAFSLFVFNGEGDVLLQQRSSDKRLWPGYWSNSCCSHPRRGESMEQATERRLLQELGIQASLEFIYKFSYQASYDEGGAEHEMCSVYLGRTNEDVVANRNEIAATRYIQPDLLDAVLSPDVEGYTPWFRMEWRRLREEFGQRLQAYCQPQ